MESIPMLPIVIKEFNEATKMPYSNTIKFCRTHDENDLCYKRCMLERTGMLYLKNEDNGGMFYTVKPYSVAKEVTNLLRFPIGVDENQIQSGWMRLEELVGSCQELGVLVPKEVEKLKCQDIPPEYQERMWGFVNCVENALDGSVCYKFCVLERNEMMFANVSESGGRNYGVNPVLLAATFKAILGITEYGPYYKESRLEEERLTQLLTKCQDLNIHVPKGDDSECKDLAPKHQEGIGKIIKCIDDTVEDETSVCYKLCRLESLGIIRNGFFELDGRNYTTYPAETTRIVKKLVSVDNNAPYGEIQAEEERLKTLVAKCEKLSFHVPEVDSIKCKDLSLESKEGIRKLINCLEDTLEHLSLLMAEESKPIGSRIYPDVTKCYKEFEDDGDGQQSRVAERMNAGVRRYQCRWNEEKEPSVCDKLCMMKRFKMIRALETLGGGLSFIIGYPLDMAIIARVLRYIDPDLKIPESKIDPEYKRIEKLLMECNGLFAKTVFANFALEDYNVPNARVSSYCEDFSSEHQEGIGKIISCIEDAFLYLRCFLASDPLDGIYPNVTKCFVGLPRDEEANTLERNQILKDECKNGNLASI
ncbi:unnamed protein product [Orchesella dallaii]|uniref:Uncharacterized protein n=1 Tax=Orchesella dallaii TaxID=48710 RepID=A0ABP1S1X3_9HEXA